VISISLVLWLLFLHWVGDSLFQSGLMAVRKGNSPVVLTQHVLIYTWTIGLGLLFRDVWQMVALYAILNGILHWLTDFVTSKLNGRLWKSGNATTPPNLHWFFVSVLSDQLVHTIALVLTASWLLT